MSMRICNGMGKTTSIRSIMGLMPHASGEIIFKGRSIVGALPNEIARLGIGLVPEGRQVFPTLTVEENLIATAGNRLSRHVPWTLSRIYDQFPQLLRRRSQFARTLSGGEQQMLAIGRALMTNPDLIILDEATEGLAPIIREEIWRAVQHLQSEGHSILLVDKNIHALQRIASRHFVIDKGRTVWSGTSADLRRDIDLVRRMVGI
jgi:branched-chain amino acid transport system ATP-binding protein